MRLVIGLDPGTGVTSPTGFVAFDPDARVLVHSERIWAPPGDISQRCRYVAACVEESLLAIDPEMECSVYIESFVMRGKAGENLARLTGALMAAVPEHLQPVRTVHNTTVKKVVGGHGRADKIQVAQGVLDYFREAELTRAEVETLIDKADWDILDAAAIGIAGHQLNSDDDEALA